MLKMRTGLMSRFSKLATLSIAVVVMMASILAVFPTKANAYGGGDGTEFDPFVIEDCQDVIDIANEMDAYYILGNNVDCQSTTFTSIGSEGNAFTGSLDGQGYKIINVALAGATNQAIFNQVDGGVIMNLYISGVTRSGASAEVASLISVGDDVTLDGIYAENNDVGSVGVVGGLIATVSGTSTIDMSYSNAILTSSSIAGGLVGTNSGTLSITNSYATGSITTDTAGGLVGTTINGSVTNIDKSYSNVTVDAATGVSGGLIGAPDDDITLTDSFSVSQLLNTTTAGGIVGSYGAGVVTTINVWFDSTRVGADVECSHSPAIANCDITDDPDYFKGNSVNTPLNQWSDGTWNRNEPGQYPSFMVGVALCDDPPQTDTVIFFRCEFLRQDNLNYTGQEVSREFRYRKFGDTGWIYGDWQTGSLLIRIGNLLPNTEYEVELHITYEIGASDWDEGTATLITGALPRDTDQDGVTDAEEMFGPNIGDANDNDIYDHEELEIASLKNKAGNYTVLDTGCAALQNVSSTIESSDAKDAAFDYATGLVGFEGIDCQSTTTVTLHYLGTYNPATITVRKYNPSSKTYTTIGDAVKTVVDFYGQPALRVTYQIVDNGPLDLNPAIGDIKDPVGLANIVVGVPNTGLN